ncbi:MAG TPA: ATP-binding cassette domain-containing protein, partial [Ilumatobacteraceae bacterium]|nr:ATP-binding cassette domain-containing protein [Ilumatobacteraceae bacterium]
MSELDTAELVASTPTDGDSGDATATYPVDTPADHGVDAPPPVIELREVSREFDADPPVRAMNHVNLLIEQGDYVAIIGPSGSGKSTLLNTLGLLDRPTSGTYLLDGIDTSELNDRERAALRSDRIGFVFQSFHLLAHRSALENVMIGSLYQGISRRERRRRAVEALDRVGLAKRAGFLPSRMSGGERQRVAVARALAARPSLLLCDEPTGNLDSATTVAVLDLFDELLADESVVHELAAAHPALDGQQLRSLRRAALL